MRLKNKIALITGGASGIGAAIAELFSQEGATVIITDIDNELGQKTAKRCKNSEFIELDVTNETQWQELSKYILKKYKHLDILVNNAGITGFTQTEGPHDPENLHLESWNKIHEINLTGVMLGCKYGIKMMKTKKSGGSIINMSSRSGLVGIPRAAAYASSKAAIRNHTKTVALYCAEEKYNIRCNSIHPGAILTPIWDPMLGEKKNQKNILKELSKDIPLGNFGKPIDVAYAALYLASDESPYTTGIELTIDGGILAGSSATPKQR